MKFLILIFVLGIVAVFAANSPQDWADKTFDFVHKFKGSKTEFFKNLQERIMDEQSKLPLGSVTEEDCKKGIELVAMKLTGGDVVNGDEFTEFFMNMKKNMKH